jgi:hypothetical protein
MSKKKQQNLNKVLWHVDLLLDNGRETKTIKQPLLSDGYLKKYVSMAVNGRDVVCAIHRDILQLGPVSS